ncbi:MAG: glycosyltransferase N-terminal domain-containing protein [Dysgonamonadaceae bacterium]|nr:glycosyltransferase N-terminal domain-containing protein [Dysgonamonadaceae bacterium]MDD4728637.1 glycosyltransferase N-terminal domain-containing protein [Dysgonamonadaceae bacterium]
MYNVAISIFSFFMHMIAPFHKKAKLMIQGHTDTFETLEKKIDHNSKYLWFHVASLGEYEQAQPMIETIKREKPTYKIILSFFSPSGYEVQKNNTIVDIVCYLPFDRKKNVKRFLDLANPNIAIFVKYEFWYNFIHGLYLRKIPVYLISATFRPNQMFFKPWGNVFKKILKYYTQIFVQDKESKRLINKQGLNNVTVMGDTRMDRVIKIKEAALDLPLVEKFTMLKDNESILVAGSSWSEDEDLIIPYFNKHAYLKLIIAPHLINEEHLKQIESKLKRPFIRYSQATEENIRDFDCLIVDNFGLLSSIYRYGQVAYIGGGFGAGIHNLPEAAVHGIPVIFGPNYHKFLEARELLNNGGGFTISNEAELNKVLKNFVTSPEDLDIAGEKAIEYIYNSAGATKKIVDKIAF